MEVSTAIILPIQSPVAQFDQLAPVDRFVGLTEEEAAERGGFEFVKEDMWSGLYWTE